MRVGEQGKSVFMGDSFYRNKEPKAQEKVAMKRGMYWKQAMHGVDSVNRAEGRMDASVAEIKDRVRLLQEEREALNAAVQEADKKMAQVKADYNIKDGSQEEKDLELLKKEFDIENHLIPGLLTEEEQKRLKEMKRTDYHNESMDIYKVQSPWKKKLDDIRKEMEAAGYAIRTIRIKRLESDAMEEAKRAKEELLEAASKEAIGILKDEAVDTMDEKAEEIKEAAESKKEEKAKKEEEIETAKEKKKEAETKTDALRENVSGMTEGVLSSETIARDLDVEIKKVLEEEKLLEEELKGLRMNLRL